MKRLGSILIMLWLTWHSQAQVVNVTATFDTTNVTVGASTTLRVFAQVAGSIRPQVDQILTWYVDLLNLTPTNANADFSTLQKRFSDSDSRTSSSGKMEGVNNLRGIFDTFLNTAGAGTTNPIEMLSCKVSFVSTGKVTFAIGPGSTVTNLATDFLVNPLADVAPFTGGIYSNARAELVVNLVAADTNVVKLRLAYSKVAGTSSNLASLTFNPVSGPNYYIEYQNTLSSTSVWQTLPGAPHNIGAYVDTNAAPTRFYRVRVVH